MAKDALPLVDATQAKVGEFPAYARRRLQTKVSQTLANPNRAVETADAVEPDGVWASAPAALRRSPAQPLGALWRWMFGLAAVTVVLVVVLIPTFKPSSGPIIQVALLDGGATRSGENEDAKMLKQNWNHTNVESFDIPGMASAWETNWPAKKQLVIKVLYDRAAGEVRVISRHNGKISTQAFQVETDLGTTLGNVNKYIDGLMPK